MMGIFVGVGIGWGWGLGWKWVLAVRMLGGEGRVDGRRVLVWGGRLVMWGGLRLSPKISLILF